MDWIDEYIFDEKILCIAEDGGSWGANQKCAQIYTGKCWVNNHAHVLKENGKASLEYIMYYLNYSNLNKYITGTTRGKLTKSALNQIQIPLPPLAEQQRLAALLDTADALRRHDRQLLDRYDQLVQSVFLELFDKKAFSIISLEEVAEKIQIGPFGSQLHREDYIVGGIPLINPMHIIGGKIKPSEEYSITDKKIKELPRYILKTNDIIMGRRGEMARCALVTEKENGWFCGTGSLYIRPKSLVNPFFLFYVLSSAKTKSYLESESKGSTMSNLNLGILNKLPVVLPPPFPPNPLCRPRAKHRSAEGAGTGAGSAERGIVSGIVAAGVCYLMFPIFYWTFRASSCPALRC